MESELSGPAGVFAVVLLEFALGSLAVLVAAPVWGVVKRGYFLLVGWSVVVGALLARLAAGSALSRIGSGASLASWSLWAFAGLSVVALVLLHRRVPAARWVATAACVPGVLAVVGLADVRSGNTAVAIAAMLTGAAFLGATWDGMLLGHWYLVDRKLTNDPMRWHAWAFTAGVVLALVSAGLGGGGRPEASDTSFNPLLAVSNITLYLAVGLVLVNALLSFFVHKLVNEGSIRAATGMLYLGVIMAMSAEFAAKAGFFTA